MAFDIIDAGPSGRGWSYYGCARRCLRLFFYRHRLHLPEPGRAAPGIGAVVHVGLANYYDRKRGVETEDLEASVNREADARAVTDDDRQLAKDVLAYYAMATTGENWTPLAAEQEYRVGFVPLGHHRFECVPLRSDDELLPEQMPQLGVPVPFTARVDLTVKDSNGWVLFNDHKTTAYMRGTTFRMYSLSGQFHGQQWIGEMHYGHVFNGSYITAIQTGRGGGKGAKGQKMVIRKPVPKAPRMVEAFPELIVRTAKQIADLDREVGMREEGWPTLSMPNGCQTIWGLCGYHARCQTG